MIPDHTLPLEELPVGVVNSHFLDSGAFTQWTLSQEFAGGDPKKRWDYYHTDEFFQYMDDYAAFIHEHKHAIDLYANVDVIGNPELTWRNQQWLEDYGLKPVPVVHFGTDLKWLVAYIARNYEIIGLGGLVGSTALPGCRRWIDQAFEMMCTSPKYLPTTKLHGFGVTTYELLIRYPWYSVDSTSWTKVGAFGGILVPHKRGGTWDFSVQPYLMKVANDKDKDAKDERKAFKELGFKPRNPDRKKHGKHIFTITKAERKIIEEWLDYIEVPLGESDHHGDAIKWGVSTHHTYRKAANLLFFEAMRDWLPDYPWPFKSVLRKGFVPIKVNRGRKIS